MTDIENFGKFSNLKGTPTIGRKMFSLKVREGKKEVKKIDQRRKFHKQKVNSCSFVVVKVLVKVNYLQVPVQISNNDLNGQRPINKIIQQTLI